MNPSELAFQASAFLRPVLAHSAISNGSLSDHPEITNFLLMIRASLTGYSITEALKSGDGLAWVKNIITCGIAGSA